MLKNPDEEDAKGPPAQPADRDLVERLLRENQEQKARMENLAKELECVFGLTRLVERNGSDIDYLLSGTVQLVADSLWHPESTCARILLHGRAYLSRNFRVSRWNQSAEIKVNRAPVGSVEVYRTHRKPDPSWEPFSCEEGLLLNAISERLGRVIERIEAQQQLESERASVVRSNTALREVLAKLQEEKMAIGHSVQENVAKIVMPLVYAIERDLLPRRSNLIELLKRQLADLTSPFVRAISTQFMSLTPAEVQVCNMIQAGLKTKEIASIRGVAPATVNRQRDRIRTKLGLRNQPVNLVMFLRSYADDLSKISDGRYHRPAPSPHST